MSDARPISMQNIADAVGVSRATVANALSGRGRVSADVAERVRAAARAMNYVPSHAGRALRTGRSTLLGLVVPDFSMPLFPDFVRAFERAAQAQGMALLVGDSMSDPAMQTKRVQDFLGRGIEAAIVIPLRGEPFDPDAFPLPVVIVDSDANPANVSSSDHRQGGRLAARHLVELGHRKVQILRSAAQSYVSQDRVAGMREVFDDAGTQYDEAGLRPDFDSGRDFALQWEMNDTTAVCAAYDAIAVGVMSGLTERGVRVPDDLSVTGFDDLIWGRIVNPPLTTIHQDLSSIADHALAVATGRAEGSLLSPMTLVTRSSTAVPRFSSFFQTRKIA
ncbi:LacI family DNA-binding transcriptional regulator [Tianweitania sp. BSSL-BM11]|uniref:LacI family DNA-binding transcriptional regulator n=1 Tax=Tianweitania aestuarii TaxID=2814886 RepID=A0ABS5RX16_9HYPH|nr:LacI family DNA-binding transcriptional regulator [Tianweitania aestuarii]MBS9720222.1 LacI family DNA-binding transcriptional regulator [Tianweitania aestuarii]